MKFYESEETIMGSGRWDPRQWARYSQAHIHNKSATKGTGGIYTSTSLKDLLNPYKVIRESCDSADNPNSTPIIIGLDVTGSMTRVLDAMARQGLPTLAEEIYNRKPVSDPHIMFMGIGDAFCDRAPLQITQFEADIRIAEQLTDLWLEEGGGGNGSEGYALAWYFAAYHTKCDAINKRGKKGYLFTVGDDGPTPFITKEQIKHIFGDDVSEDIDAKALLQVVSRDWEVFHLTVEEGHTASEAVKNRWKQLLGERAVTLADHTKMGEVIVSLLQVLAGVDKDTVANSWDGSTAIVVRQAISDLTTPNGGSGGLVKF